MSIAMQALEKAKSLLTQRQQSRVDSFRSLIRAIADGNAPDADTLERTLADCGKTMADLEAAVKLIDARRVEADHLARGEAMTAERAKVESAIGKLNAELEAAEKKHEEAMWPLSAKWKEIEQAENRAQTAKSELYRSADPELKAEIATVGAELAAASSRASELRKVITDRSHVYGVLKTTFAVTDDGRQHALNSPYTVENLTGPQQRILRSSKKPETWLDIINSDKAELAELEKKIKQLTAQRDEIQSRLMIP